MLQLPQEKSGWLFWEMNRDCSPHSEASLCLLGLKMTFLVWRPGTLTRLHALSHASLGGHPLHVYYDALPPCPRVRFLLRAPSSSWIREEHLGSVGKSLTDLGPATSCPLISTTLLGDLRGSGPGRGKPRQPHRYRGAWQKRWHIPSQGQPTTGPEIVSSDRGQTSRHFTNGPSTLVGYKPLGGISCLSFYPLICLSSQNCLLRPSQRQALSLA